MWLGLEEVFEPHPRSEETRVKNLAAQAEVCKRRILGSLDFEQGMSTCARGADLFSPCEVEPPQNALGSSYDNSTWTDSFLTGCVGMP